MDWNREVLGVPLKYAVPLIGAVFVGAVVFILWRARSGAGGGSSATGVPTASTLSASGAQLAAAGIGPYYGNAGVPTGQSQAQQITITPWAHSFNPDAKAWVTAQPGSGNIVSQLPAGSSADVIGTATGPPAGDPLHTTGYYKVNLGGLQGYVSAADVGSGVPSGV